MFSFFKKIKDNLIPITNDNQSIESELQDAEAQFNLGVMYENGLEVTHDYKEAFKWFNLSAKQGCADAQNNLGVMFENGLGVVKIMHKPFTGTNLPLHKKTPPDNII